MKIIVKTICIVLIFCTHLMQSMEKKVNEKSQSYNKENADLFLISLQQGLGEYFKDKQFDLSAYNTQQIDSFFACLEKGLNEHYGKETKENK